MYPKRSGVLWHAICMTPYVSGQESICMTCLQFRIIPQATEVHHEIMHKRNSKYFYSKAGAEEKKQKETEYPK